MPTKIKICGLTRPEDVAAANDCRPDYVGFVFAAQSRRALTPLAAAALRRALDPGIGVVGVFVNAPPTQVATLLGAGIIDIAQLHGQEDAAYLAAQRALPGVAGREIGQACRGATAADVARAGQSAADRVLLDHGPGGTGQAFDWSLLRHARRGYILAGGLSPDNVAAALRAAQPFAVDVSSGVETQGVKDAGKMRAFVEIVRGLPLPPTAPPPATHLK